MSVTFLGDAKHPDAREDEKGGRYFTRYLLFEVSDANWAGQTLLENPNVPSYGAPYEFGTEFYRLSVATDFSCDEVEDSWDPWVWMVTVEYTPLTLTAEEQQNREDRLRDIDPVDRQPMYQWFAERYQKPATGSWNIEQGSEFPAWSSGVVNSAGEPFDPPPMIDDARLGLRITRNERNANPELWMKYNNALNKDVFLGAAPGQCKMHIGGANEQWENGFQFWQVSYEILFNFDGWVLELLDHGSFSNSAGTITKFTDEGGSPVIKLLDGSGAALADGADPVFLEFNVYRQEFYAALALVPPARKGLEDGK